MGGPAWRGKFALGFPILGELGEPGVYPPSNQPPSYISRKELFDKDAGRFLSSKTTSDPNERLLWFEAIDQVKKKRLDGPRRYSEQGELVVNDGPELANPGFNRGQT